MLAVRRVPSWPASGERVDADRHGETRLVHSDHGQRARIVGIGKRLADRDLRNACDRNQLARSRLLGLDTVERFRHVELR